MVGIIVSRLKSRLNGNKVGSQKSDVSNGTSPNVDIAFYLLNMKFSLYKLHSSLLNYSPDNELVLRRLRGKTITRKQLEITTTTTTTTTDSQPMSRDFVGYGIATLYDDGKDDEDRGCSHPVAIYPGETPATYALLSL